MIGKRVFSLKGIGIVRKVDQLGRIVLPKELREILAIQTHDGVEIFVDQDKIVLKKFNPCCIVCNSTLSLFYFRDKIICENCLQETAKYARQLGGAD